MPISSGEKEAFPRAPSTPRRSVATPSSLYPSLLDGVLRAGRRGRIGRSGESSSRRSPASYLAPTPPWWTRSRDAGLAAEFCCCSFDSFPFPPPVYLITHYQRSRASGARGTLDAGSRSGSLSRVQRGRGQSHTESQSPGAKLKNPHPPISRPAKLDATGSLQPAGGRTAHKYTALFSASSEQRKTRPERSSQRSTLTERSLCQVAETAPANPRTPPVKR